MDLEYFYKTLAHTKFKNLSMAADNPGEIREADKPQIIFSANEALLRLHTRFTLKTKDVWVEQVEHITFYHLLKKYAQSQSPQPEIIYPYIMDLFREPFQEDVLNIIEVFDADGENIPLNDPGLPGSVFTPQSNVLQIPSPKAGKPVSVVYRARPRLLSLDDSPDTVIELPVVLEAALLAYTAYSVYSSMNTPEAVSNSQEQLMLYETLCTEILLQDAVNSSVVSANSRFLNNGWR